MATQRSTQSAKGKTAKKATKKQPQAKASERRDDERRTDKRPGDGERRQEARRNNDSPAGAHATGPADFIITRKWSGKTVESHVGAHVRVELPESTLRGMAWQLLKLPHGVQLEAANVQALSPPDGQMNQHRVFDFNLTEAGEYTLQFTLQRSIGQQGVADTFKLKLQARDN